MKKLTGTIVSDKMDKTRTVAVVEKRRHPIYDKAFTVTGKIKAHDEKNEFVSGDVVEIVPVRPISKDKAWKIVKKVK
ncbi:TPA: 30S ribosomal protein S17 [Candidatus Berkelbacteria bacterium]|uniref:Small ribosomal subunit protein uS17 n=1 Tax=Berkelbacteria bacterium GW2011_GWE1_39_12 TaxID=1618337 RepID=A0A0G4B485_9BACT|nr:MAG: ribosomal protein S17 (BS16) [Berkelbacteria bacterium GW2011_GWE1_39_12]HBO60219.1 30S ribosomal protein S17 [Candidatus Berkelbacteria bacterium]